MTRVAERMTVAGVGLIGASLALAAKQAGLVGEVVGYGRTVANLEVALRAGAIDRIASEPAAAMAGADLVVLAAPLGACAALAERFRPHARPGTLLTDVGSVKAGIVADLERIWADVGPVVGTHPLAGSEASGAGAARADLFQGRRCILTPTSSTDAGALARVRRLWEGVGATVEEMPAGTHDLIVASVSHLPHLVAYALVTATAETRAAGRPVLDYAASGFLDTTRIAASRAELWRDIALANAVAIKKTLDAFRTALGRLESLLASGDGEGLEAALDDAAAVRRRLGGHR